MAYTPLPPPFQMFEIAKNGKLRKKYRRGYRAISNHINCISATIDGTTRRFSRRKYYRIIFGVELNTPLFPHPKKRKPKKSAPKKKYIPKPNDALYADGVEKLSAQDAYMRGIEDLFFGFNSYTGIQQNTQHEHYLTADEGKKIGLEPLLLGSSLYIGAKKQLYLWNGSNYVLLNKDRSSARVYKNYHPQIVQILKNKQDTQ